MLSTPHEYWVYAILTNPACRTHMRQKKMRREMRKERQEGYGF